MMPEVTDPSSSVAMVQLGLVCVVIAVLTWLSNKFFQRTTASKSEEEEEQSSVEMVVPEHFSSKPSHKKQKKSQPTMKATKQAGLIKFEHEDLVAILKGHNGLVVDFSFSTNGKYMVSAGEDRSLIMYSTKEFDTKGTRNTVRGKVDLDNPVAIDFAPDSRSVAVGLELSGSVKVMKVVKDDAGVMGFQDALELPSLLNNDLLTCAISPSQTYIMVADDKEEVFVVDLRGGVLGKIDAKCGGVIRQCEVSPCGRFIVFSGNTLELPVYEVDFSSTNVFRAIKKVMILKGHSREIVHFAFSLDAVSMATVARDGSWRVHSIDVRYKDQEEPRLIASGTFQGIDPESGRCFLSCNGKLLGVYDETNVQLISVVTGEVYITYSGFGNTTIVKSRTDNLARHVVIALGKGFVVLRNKYQSLATIAWLKSELDKSSSPQMKSRLQQQLLEEQLKLEACETPKDTQTPKEEGWLYLWL
jgi:WD40 repeat protein